MSSNLKIVRKGVFETMTRYSRLVVEIVGKGIEVAGYVIEGKEVRLFENQNITPTYCSFESSIADAFSEMLREGKFISDMWHSHGFISTFHSVHDDAHFDHMFEYTKKLYRVLGKEDPRLGSLVVNANTEITGECYAERIDESGVKKSLEVLLDGDVSRKSDYELVKDLGRCVKYKGVGLSCLENYDKVLNKYKQYKDKVKPTYTSMMSSYAERSQGLVEEMIRVLKGETIDGNSYWLWCNREKRFNDLYELATEKERMELSRVVDALEKNRYLKKKYPALFQRIKEKLEDNSLSGGFLCDGFVSAGESCAI